MQPHPHSPHQPPHTASIGSRLKQEMKKRGISSAELARRADVLTSFLYDIISGKSHNPSTVKLARVAEALEVSLLYLVNGEIAADTHSSPPIQTSEYVAIAPLTGATPPQTGIVFHRTWLTQHFTASPEDLRLLIIQDDSMEPTLKPHDMVLVDTSSNIPSPPGVFMINDGLGISAKRLEYSSASTTTAPAIQLITDNPRYSNYQRSIEEISIVGRIVWVSRAL